MRHSHCSYVPHYVMLTNDSTIGIQGSPEMKAEKRSFRDFKGIEVNSKGTGATFGLLLATHVTVKRGGLRLQGSLPWHLPYILIISVVWV